MKVVREEIFGPVLVAAPFSDLDEIAAVANDSEYGLGAGIWTKDISKAHALAKKIRAGTIWINCYNVFDAALPFGGYKQSGWDARWAARSLTTTPRSRPSPLNCEPTAVRRGRTQRVRPLPSAQPIAASQTASDSHPELIP